MKLTVLSPERLDGREPTVVMKLFEAGLESYHVRKPLWSRTHLAEWLHTIPEVWRPRIILHTHHDLAEEFGLGGIHFREHERDGVANSSLREMPGITSCACHDLASLAAARVRFDRVLLSPIFDSISKIDYGPVLDPGEVQRALKHPPAGSRAEVFALGGIAPGTVSRCADMGFDGVALLGAIWRAVDPISVFKNVQNLLLPHAV